MPFSLVKNTRIVKLVDLLSLRTHFIDEHVAAAHDGSGVEQLVILGAGLDARGYRLKEFKGKVIIMILYILEENILDHFQCPFQFLSNCLSLQGL